MSTKNNDEEPLRLNKSGDTRGMHPNSQKHYVKPRWKKGESGNPAGRPKDRVKELMNGLLTVKQVKENTNLNEHEINAIERIIMSLDTTALQAIAKSEKTPAYMRTLAMAAMWDMKNGKTNTMNLLRDRQFGAVKKTVDVTTNGESMNSETLTMEEAGKFIEEIEKKYIHGKK